MLRKVRNYNPSGIKFVNGKYFDKYGREFELDLELFDKKIKDGVGNATLESLRLKRMEKGGNVEKLDKISKALKKGSKTHKKQSEQLESASKLHKKQSNELVD